MQQSWLTDSVIANPMSEYAAYRESRTTWFGRMTGAVVEIVTEDGIHGLGFIGGGKGSAAKVIIDEHFRDLLIGQDATDLERLWEQLYRASIMYGRRGLAIEAISGIDIALWDIRGKVTGLPVYQLLGGRTKDKLRVYVTGSLTDRHISEGFRNVKLALPFGPADAEAGLRKNEELVRRTRERVGADGQIMLDCYMSLTVDYTIELARRIKDYRIRWIEEPVMPDQVDAYRRIRDAVDVMITGGEHEYTRFGFREWIEKQAVDILQPDIYRAGGISELKRIAAMASAYGIPVIPHGIGAPTYHFVMATVNAPEAEFVDVFAEGGELMLHGEPLPAGGYIELADTPGFGYSLNKRALTGEAQIAPIW